MANTIKANNAGKAASSFSDSLAVERLIKPYVRNAKPDRNTCVNILAIKTSMTKAPVRLNFSLNNFYLPNKELICALKPAASAP